MKEDNPNAIETLKILFSEHTCLFKTHEETINSYNNQLARFIQEENKRARDLEDEIEAKSEARSAAKKTFLW